MKLFAINFVIGVATGIILEFQFGTNWSNYSWMVGDIFGAPWPLRVSSPFSWKRPSLWSCFLAGIGFPRVSPVFHLDGGGRLQPVGGVDPGGQRLDAVSGRPGL
jgi:cytochrome bd ubiquinol oxidase subunit I